MDGRVGMDEDEDDEEDEKEDDGLVLVADVELDAAEVVPDDEAADEDATVCDDAGALDDGPTGGGRLEEALDASFAAELDSSPGRTPPGPLAGGGGVPLGTTGSPPALDESDPTSDDEESVRAWGPPQPASATNAARLATPRTNCILPYCAPPALSPAVPKIWA
jgi:hypothetical protein